MRENATDSLISRAARAVADFFAALARSLNIGQQNASRTNSAMAVRDDASSALQAYQQQPESERDPGEEARLQDRLRSSEAAVAATRMTEAAMTPALPAAVAAAGEGLKKEDHRYKAALERMFADPKPAPDLAAAMIPGTEALATFVDEYRLPPAATVSAEERYRLDPPMEEPPARPLQLTDEPT